MTHSQRVLQLLSDGKPHTHHELYRLGVMGHSRVADLRKQGHEIECWRDGENYLYQLLVPGVCTSPDGTVRESVSPPLTANQSGARSPEPSPTSTVRPLLPEGLPPEPGPVFPEPGPGQLSVFAA